MSKNADMLYSLLGDLPSREQKISSRLVKEEDKGNFILEHLVLELNGEEPVPAFFSRPKNAKPPYKTILYSHSHGGFYEVGKKELIKSAPYQDDYPYANLLADMGIAALSIDHWCFGERQGRSESDTYKAMLLYGKVMWGMMVFDSLRAIDYLHTREDVDTNSIGALGMSMGSSMTFWTAALEPRIKYCVDICCMGDFEELIRTGGLECHGIYLYVPSLLKHFSTADINKLIAPRPHLSTIGKYDRLTPLAGTIKIEQELIEHYKAAGAEGSFKLLQYPCGHLETAAMRADITEFIKANA